MVDKSRLIMGCMGLGGGWSSEPPTKQDIQQAHQLIDAALDSGITVFDHADIYTFGKAEQVFGEVLKQRPELKSSIHIQSKCGIRIAGTPNGGDPGRYDFSYQHITSSVEGILSRLTIEQLPLLLLHRPDPLADMQEVAKAFQDLKRDGKVAAFGVSNFSAAQMEFLTASTGEKLVANQLEMSLLKHGFVEQGICVNQESEFYPQGMNGVIEYCQLNDIELQSWGALAQGVLSGKSLDSQPLTVVATAELVSSLAAEYQVSKEAIVLAWLLRHPAKIKPVIGTTNPDRIRACQQGLAIELSREHWYQLYTAARGQGVP
jgi:predicted oxidoreductase